MSAPSVLIAGCGDIGSRLASQLMPDDWTVYGLRRSVEKLPNGVLGVSGDLFDPAFPLTGRKGDWITWSTAPHLLTGMRRVIARLMSKAFGTCWAGASAADRGRSGYCSCPAAASMASSTASGLMKRRLSKRPGTQARSCAKLNKWRWTAVCQLPSSG